MDLPAHTASTMPLSTAAPLLLTPGPLTTSLRTKQAMLHDLGSWDAAFTALTARVRAALLDIVHGAPSHDCVPLQGSGTFAVEAALGSLLPRDARVLVPNNGAYCARIVTILGRLGRTCVELPLAENEAADAAAVESALVADASISHVALVHCETSAGLLNPLPAIAAAVARQRRALFVDAMSSFGALDIDLRSMPIDALVAASGKCLEGVPGMGFVLARRELLAECAGRSDSVALDLHEQWRYMERSGQWRFTPPTQVVAALDEAITQYLAEGGRAARAARYTANCAALRAGLEALGLRCFLPDALQAPIIVTVHAPADPAYDFRRFYDGVRARGFILYPGKLTQAETFRVGCIGAIDADDIARAVAAIGDTLHELGVALRRGAGH